MLGFKGQPDWLAGAVLVGAFDLPTDTATQMIYDYFGDPPEGWTPGDAPEMPVNVCTRCAARARRNLLRPVVVMGDGLIPWIEQP